MQKMTKVKASDKFSFPTSLSKAAVLGGQQAVVDLEAEEKLGDEYELAAILFHKGSSASHGHYGTLAT